MLVNFFDTNFACFLLQSFHHGLLIALLWAGKFLSALIIPPYPVPHINIWKSVPYIKVIYFFMDVPQPLCSHPLGNNIEFHLPYGRFPTIRTSLGASICLVRYAHKLMVYQAIVSCFNHHLLWCRKTSYTSYRRIHTKKDLLLYLLNSRSLRLK